MKVFEIELHGFCGDTDETDDCIIWVKAKGIKHVQKMCNLLKVHVNHINEITDTAGSGIDLIIHAK